MGDDYDEEPKQLQAYLTTLSDETLKELTEEELDILRQCRQLTGHYPKIQYEENDSDCSDNEGEEETEHMWKKANQEEEPTRLFECFKVRKRRDDTNPTVRMLEKDEALMSKWVDALQTNEFEPMRDRMLTRRTEEEALRIGITPHVTDMMKKN